MFINRLEMTGFKSFAGRTVIEFRPGVMAVVGPNGCGKTNIVDAIRWALGEQRSGALRADRMEAVIFNGSSRRKPVGMSEVTLTLDNDQGRLPTAYSEVALTRRLFRSGESEYLVNRSPCRLRDIQDLFVNTGFGHSTYSIMELAMVERIITGPSEERRALLEEAAGVSKYKSRRQAAEKRLDSTRDNLARLDDVFIEVEKNYKTLKRQASRARRHQEISQAVTLRLRVDLSGQYLELKSRLTGFEKNLAEGNQKLQQLETEISRRSAELISFEGQELVLLDKTSRAQEAQKRLDRREAELKGELALARQRAAHLEAEREGIKTRRQDWEAAWTRVNNSQAQTSLEVETASKRLNECQEQLAAVDKELSLTQESGDKTALQLTKVREQEAALQRSAEALKDEQSRRQKDIEHLRQVLQRSSAEIQRLTAEIDKLEKNSQRTASELQKAKTHNDALKEALNHADNELETARQAHRNALQTQVLASAARTAAQAALSTHQQQRATASAWPPAFKKKALELSLASVAARIECPPRYKAAVASALNQALEAVDLESLEQALNLTQTIQSDERAVIRIPSTDGLVTEPPPRPDLLPDCIWAPDIVQNSGELGDFLKHRLGRTIIIANRDKLEELCGWANEYNFSLVSPEGERIEPDGLVYLGGIDPEARQLGWNARLKELSEALAKTQGEFEAAEIETKQAQERTALAESNAKAARQALQAGEDNELQLQRRQTGNQADKDRVQRRRQELSRENSEQLKRLKSLEEALSTAPEATGEQKITRLNLENARLSGELKRLEKTRSELAERRTAFVTERIRLSERLTSARSTTQESASELTRLEAERAGLESRFAQSEAESSRVTHAALNLENQIKLVNKEQSKLSDDLEQINNDKSILLKERQNSKSTLDQAQREQREALREQSRWEGELIGQRAHLLELERRLREDAGVEAKYIDSDTADSALAKLETLGLSDAALETLKSRLAALGPVNMLALDELSEIEKRYNFLTDQRKDLIKAVETLEETIDRINIEARLRLTDVYEQVNRNFQNLFRTLFEGGEARLTLEGTDPLEAEVRVWATPTGKKLQALAMLSGGEKALTAIALLFAIYQVRPSPFCILDEVDAPLDDANIIRFNRLIRSFSQDTQFLIVTHNKRTMEAADSLFGVTLNDEGVSQIVSVNIEKQA